MAEHTICTTVARYPALLLRVLAPLAAIVAVGCSGSQVRPSGPAEATIEEPAGGSEAAPAPDLDAAVPEQMSKLAELLADPAAVARGQGLFRAVCTGYCHSTRPADRVAPDLFDCEWALGGDDEEIFATITEGVPDTQMLGFGGKIENDDLWKIVAYLRDATRCGEAPS